MRSLTRLRIQATSISALRPRSQPQIFNTFRNRPPTTSNSLTHYGSHFESSNRTFSGTVPRKKEDYAARAKQLHQNSADDYEEDFNSQIDDVIGEAKELQARTPWHREGSDKPPVKRMRSAGAMTKGLSLSHFPSSLYHKPNSTDQLLTMVS
jgi:hypothetical protein